MSNLHAALVTVFLFAPVVHAADQLPKMSAADIKKNLTAAASDPTKVTAYCAMSKKMDEVGDDEKKAEAAGDEIDGYFKTLGDDFKNAWDPCRAPPTGLLKQPRWMKPLRHSTRSASDVHLGAIHEGQGIARADSRLVVRSWSATACSAMAATRRWRSSGVERGQSCCGRRGRC